MRTVLITGARGFVGTPTAGVFVSKGWGTMGACRGETVGTGDGGPSVRGQGPEAGRSRSVVGAVNASGHREVVVGEIGPDTNWTQALVGVDVVVHLAARVHQMRDRAADPLAEFRRVNVEGTRRLAEQAAAAGVKRFVFVSSIKVNGEGTEGGQAFSADDAPGPQDDYGRSKAEAEDALRATCAGTSMEWVIIRPPLMVGKGVKGNLASLAEAIRRGRPLPLGAIQENRRSLLDVRNLAELIERCAWHPAAAGQVFLASDGVPVSTAELARQVGRAVGRKPWLIPVPVFWLRLAGRITRRSAAVERLTGNLLIDDRKTRRLLEWTPRFGPDDWEV